MRSAKVYDYNDTLVSMAGAWNWVRDNHPDLYHKAKVIGKKDKEVYRQVRPKLIEVVEEATKQGLYEVTLFPGVRDRLDRDHAEGHEVIVFTGAPDAVVSKQLSDMGIAGLIDDTLNVDELARIFGLGQAMKEDPELYVAMMQTVQRTPRTLVAYTDDTPRRLNSAIVANQRMGEQGFARFYLFDPKGKHGEGEGYRLVHSILDAE